MRILREFLNLLCRGQAESVLIRLISPIRVTILVILYDYFS